MELPRVAHPMPSALMISLLSRENDTANANILSRWYVPSSAYHHRLLIYTIYPRLGRPDLSICKRNYLSTSIDTNYYRIERCQHLYQ